MWHILKAVTSPNMWPLCLGAYPVGMIFSGAGLVFLGGLMGGTLGVTLVIKKNNLFYKIIKKIRKRKEKIKGIE